MVLDARCSNAFSRFATIQTRVNFELCCKRRFFWAREQKYIFRFLHWSILLDDLYYENCFFLTSEFVKCVSQVLLVIFFGD